MKNYFIYILTGFVLELEREKNVREKAEEDRNLREEVVSLMGK